MMYEIDKRLNYIYFNTSITCSVVFSSPLNENARFCMYGLNMFEVLAKDIEY